MIAGCGNCTRFQRRRDYKHTGDCSLFKRMVMAKSWCKEHDPDYRFDMKTGKWIMQKEAEHNG